jgi:hypothetical protein
MESKTFLLLLALPEKKKGHQNKHQNHLPDALFHSEWPSTSYMLHLDISKRCSNIIIVGDEVHSLKYLLHLILEGWPLRPLIGAGRDP